MLDGFSFLARSLGPRAVARRGLGQSPSWGLGQEPRRGAAGQSPARCFKIEATSGWRVYIVSKDGLSLDIVFSQPYVGRGHYSV